MVLALSKPKPTSSTVARDALASGQGTGCVAEGDALWEWAESPQSLSLPLVKQHSPEPILSPAPICTGLQNVAVLSA